jgi:hypothetical protein
MVFVAEIELRLAGCNRARRMAAEHRRLIPGGSGNVLENRQWGNLKAARSAGWILLILMYKLPRRSFAASEVTLATCWQLRNQLSRLKQPTRRCT